MYKIILIEIKNKWYEVSFLMNNKPYYKYKPIKNYPEYMIREILNLITTTTTQAPETVLNEADIESPDPDTVVINVDEGV